MSVTNFASEIKTKQEERDEIAKQTTAFLAKKGKVVKQIPTGMSSTHPEFKKPSYSGNHQKLMTQIFRTPEDNLDDQEVLESFSEDEDQIPGSASMELKTSRAV